MTLYILSIIFSFTVIYGTFNESNSDGLFDLEIFIWAFLVSVVPVLNICAVLLIPPKK